MPDAVDNDPLTLFLGQEIVLDTQGPLIFIGTLVKLGAAFLVLEQADVHDTNDSRASKELYILETRDLGVRVNRAAAIIMRSQIASASLLRDIVD